MSRFHSYISTASKILDHYDGNKPFAFHIKAFFATEKKFGSRDRRTILSLCYNYFRIGHLSKNLLQEEKMLLGIFLCENHDNELLQLMRPEWNKRIGLAVRDKLMYHGINSADIFPFMYEVSDEIEKESFAVSFLQQPYLYLRVRPGKLNQVTRKLNHASVSFHQLNESCLQFANTTSLDSLLDINSEAVVQDYNSQRALNFLQDPACPLPPEDKINAWDCCAASGGKSMLLYDLLEGNVKLTVSDIRENILLNLSKRLRQAGINIYRKFKTDLSENAIVPAAEQYSLIICDAPCTGSGTWSRTPEQLFYFDRNSIDQYAERQQKIVSNVIPQLQPNGLFFYITCSVFKKENEMLAAFIKEKFHLQLLKMEYLKGYDKRADNLFVAVFIK